MSTITKAHGDCETAYSGTREALIRAKVASPDMFPTHGECSKVSSPLKAPGGWQTQRTRGGKFIVIRYDYPEAS